MVWGPQKESEVLSEALCCGPRPCSRPCLRLHQYTRGLSNWLTLLHLPMCWTPSQRLRVLPRPSQSAVQGFSQGCSEYSWSGGCKGAWRVWRCLKNTRGAKVCPFCTFVHCLCTLCTFAHFLPFAWCSSVVTNSEENYLIVHSNTMKHHLEVPTTFRVLWRVKDVKAV